MAWTERYVSVAGAGAHDGTSEANAWTLAEAIAAPYASGQRINVIAGTYSSGATNQTFGVAGTDAAPIHWRGYNTAIGDLDTVPTSQRTPGTDCPLFTSTTGRYHVSQPYQWFSNISFTSAYTAAGTVMARGATCKYIRCRFENTATAAAAHSMDNTAHYNVFTECHFIRSGAYINVDMTAHSMFIHCVVDGGSVGLSLGNAFCRVLGSIIKGQSTTAISVGATGTALIYGCTLYNSLGDLIENSGTSNQTVIANCYFHTAGAYAIDWNGGTGSSKITLVNNAYYDSSFTTARKQGVAESEDLHAIVDTGDKFTNAAGGDFTLISSSNAYNVETLFEKDGPTTFDDVGAIRHEDAGGGGAASVLGSGNLSGGFAT